MSKYPLQAVVFAGGEPSLLKADLIKAIEFCSHHGIWTRVVTNASWATNLSKARDKVQAWRDAGLNDLNVSADDYHLPYIPLDNVKSVWIASKGMGFNCCIVSLAEQVDSVVTVESLRDLLGANTPTVYDESGRSQSNDDDRDEHGTLYAICNRQTSQCGRGRDRLERASIIFHDAAAIDIPCPWIRNSPALSPRNELVSCCGFEVRAVPELNYGSAEHALESGLIDQADDVLLHAIARIGPAKLAEFIRRNKKISRLYDKHTSMCEACEDVMSDPANIHFLRQNAAILAGWMLDAKKRSDR